MTSPSRSTDTNMCFKRLQPANALAGSLRSRPTLLAQKSSKILSSVARVTRSTLKDTVSRFLPASELDRGDLITNADLDNLGAGTASSGASLPTLSKSRDRKETSAPARKSLEIKTKLKGSMKKDKADASSASSSDAEKTDKSKGRSQSRKRNSIFALLGNKKEEDGKKDEKVDKAEEKAEKKHDEEVAIKAQKLDKENATEVEKEVKQAESTASHPPVNVAEVGAAG